MKNFETGEEKSLWKYRPANNIGENDWVSLLPDGLFDQIKDEDFLNTIDTSEKDIKKIQENPIQKNRISVILSAYNGDDVLPHTFREVTKQIKKAGSHGEIFTILNRGGGTTNNYLNPENAEKIKEELGLSEIIFTKSDRDHLTNDDKNNPKISGKVQLEPSCIEATGDSDIKLIVIEQEESDANAGKIRGLRDGYDFLFDISTQGNFRPEFLFAIDAETILYPRNKETGEVSFDNENCILSLIEKTKTGEHVVGAKSEFIPFKEGQPDWNADIYLITAMLNRAHGMPPPPGYKPLSEFGDSKDSPLSFLCGGATFGDYSLLCGLMKNISRMFPGIRTEDTLLSIAIRLLSIETFIDEEVIHLNRCPAIENKDRLKFSKEGISEDEKIIQQGSPVEAVLLDSERQMARWLQGNAGIRKVVPENIYHLCSRDPSFKSGNSLSMQNYELRQNLKLRKPITYNQDELVGILDRFNKFIQEIVDKFPDDIKEGDAVWTNR